MLTYFADPYSSWQRRGGNENRNGRITPRYLPKGTGFEDLTQDESDAIVQGDQRHPMKLLGYKNAQRGGTRRWPKLQSKQADPETSRCTYKLNPGARAFTDELQN